MMGSQWIPRTSTLGFFLEDRFVPHRTVKLSADTGALVADVSFDDTNKGKKTSVNGEFKSLFYMYPFKHGKCMKMQPRRKRLRLTHLLLLCPVFVTPVPQFFSK